MSEARTVWHDLETGRNAAARSQSGLLLGAGLLIAMCVGELLFLNYLAGPEAANILAAAEGMAIVE